MKFLFLLIFLPSFTFSQITKNGFDYYVNNNSQEIFNEFQIFCGSEIDREISFQPDDILLYGNDTNELGLCLPNLDMIIISNDLNKYRDYTKKDIRKSDLKKLTSDDIFVRGVIIHEICHIYIDFLIDNFEKIKRDYKYYKKNGAIFIEESICEYASYKMGELIIKEKYYIPKTINELSDSSKKLRYEYGIHFIKPILDKYGFQKGSLLILKNDPPTDEEILKPEIYYKRIEDEVYFKNKI